MYSRFSGVATHLPEMFVYGTSSEAANFTDGIRSAQNLNSRGCFNLFHFVPYLTMSFGFICGRSGAFERCFEKRSINSLRLSFAFCVCGAVKKSLSLMSSGLRSEM